MAGKKKALIPVVRADEKIGLTVEEAAARTAAGLDNRPVKPPSKTVPQIIFTNTFTYFNMLFCALAAAIFIVGAWYDAAFMGVVVSNTVIGIIQELRSKKKLDKLNIVTSPRALVVRGGEERTVPAAETVRDDIVIFRAGDQIYADAEVISGACRVNESLVTGEADEIVKDAGGELLSGSFVVSGTCRARLTAVGADSFASKLTVEARRSGRTQKSEMMRSLSRLVAAIGIFAIPFGALHLYKEMAWLGRGMSDAVTSTVAALVGMIPEGLYLLTSIALVAGVIRLSQRKTLVHEMACIETLARVDTLCVDKTGTITEDKMTFENTVLLDPDAFPVETVEAVMADYCAAVGDENDTMRALSARFGAQASKKAIRTVHFTSSKKYGGVGFEDGVTYVLGAPEILLGGKSPELAARAGECARGGRRVLLLAKYAGELSEEGGLAGEVSPVSFFILGNRVREEAPETFRWFAAQGVSVKVISGDNPVTVSEVALSAGIEGAELAVDARTLDTDEKLAEAAVKYTIFGRVTPDQKKKLILAMKAAGHTVAMTGDGVNDVLALREADCSVAMASGSAAAGQVANIVLLNSDFSSMPSVVAEGRRVINNIERSASLYLVKNIFTFVLAVVTLFFSLPYPFAPSQLTLVNMMTIGIPSFILAMEPNKRRVEGRFMRNVISRALPAASADLFLILGIVFVYTACDLNGAALSTVCTLAMGAVGLHTVDRVCRPYNGSVVRIVLTSSMTVLFFTGFALMTAFLTRAPLVGADYIALAAALVLSGILLEVFSLLLRVVRERIGKKSA